MESCLYTAANSIEAHLLEGLLSTAGITVRLEGEPLMGAAGELPVEVQQIKLWCDEFQLDKALALVADYLANAGRDWPCPACGEANGGSFEICWHCRTPRPM
ncbi:DUF2007 domain-containing protein [Gallaecimonas sp. GXIMD4217]|uniref:putative signal transducing protein n=1 Tax=Gallaecimonas sp. GXIMD4217 TaxID=3131927 RepID=UPI00311B2320